jgi:opacity protein-like surface antigen
MNPNRLVLDLMGVRTVSSPSMVEINELGLVSIRSALNRPGVARVVFNFSDEIPQYRIEETGSGLAITFWKETMGEREMEPEARATKPVEPEKKEEPKITPVTKKTTKPAEEVRSYREEPSKKKMMALGFSAGYQAFQDEAFKEAYGEGGVFFQGEYSFYLPLNVESFDIWTSFAYFKKAGKTSVTQEDLELKITDLAIALRYLRTFSMFTPFVGAGIDYVVYKEILPEDFMVESVGGSTLGFHLQGGTYFNLLPNLSLKVQIKYLWAKTTENEIEVNLGGIKYGAGLVFRFNL